MLHTWRGNTCTQALAHHSNLDIFTILFQSLYNRAEIQYHEPLMNYTSNEKAKWFFDNMTEYLDSLLLIQEEVAHRISEEVDIVLAQVIFKVGRNLSITQILSRVD